MDFTGYKNYWDWLEKNNLTPKEAHEILKKELENSKGQYIDRSGKGAKASSFPPKFLKGDTNECERSL